MEPVEVTEGVVVAMVPYRPQLVGNVFTGSLHGGVVTTLIDQTSGAAVISCLGGRESVATLDLRIDHLRATVPDKPLYARAECYRLTASIAFVRCTAYQDQAIPVATSMSSFMRMGQRGTGDPKEGT